MLKLFEAKVNFSVTALSDGSLEDLCKIKIRKFSCNRLRSLRATFKRNP